MPTYEITSPEGRKFQVTAPDGATQEQVMAYVQAQNAPYDAGTAAQRGAAEVAKEYGPVGAGMVAAGRTADRLLQGVKQQALNVPAAFGHQGATDELARMEKEQAGNTEAFKALEEARPVSTFVGGAAPMLAMPVLGSGIAGMAAGAALPGLMEYGTGSERLMRGGMGAAGGALGGMIGKGLSRAPQPFKPNLTQTQQEAMAAADRIGAKLRPDEVVNSKPLKWLNAALQDMPFSGGMAQKESLARLGKINSAAARSIGVNGASEITDDVLATARKQISGEFQRILAPLEVPLDKQFVNDVRAITGSKVMKALRNDSTESVIAPFRNIPQGVKAKGDWFQQNLTALNDEVRAAYSAGETGKAKALESFEGALHRAAQRGMSPQDRAAYEVARKQWANLRILETGKVVDGGNVVPHRLESALQSRYKQAFKEGKLSGELVDIAKAGHSMRTMPQSGTTPRALYSGLAGGAAFAEPVTAATMMAAPPAIQKFLQSDAGRKYLTQGLLNISPEVERAMMLGGSGLLGAGATLAAP